MWCFRWCVEELKLKEKKPPVQSISLGFHHHHHHQAESTALFPFSRRRAMASWDGMARWSMDDDDEIANVIEFFLSNKAGFLAITYYLLCYLLLTTITDPDLLRT